MRAIKDMSILEIDITNACMNRCSNCTRFCGHHNKPYFMEYATFQRAVDSLEGFGGLISIMGGEPLLHPEFERFAAYLEEKRSTKALFDHKSKAIVKDYLSYAQAQRWFNNAYNKGTGYNVFTSIPAQFYRNYERIQDTFTHMFLNDHTNPSFHQPILISRKDLGIGDEDFAVMREKCWLQNFWSASITPKGAFFCEIAGTLDMLLNGPGGWKIEPGWWKRDINSYEEQFRYCDFCGMALKTFSRNANDEMDDASATLYEKLKTLNTPRFRQKRVQLYDPNQHVEKDGETFSDDMNSVTANYEPNYEKRVGTAALNLRPKCLIGVAIIKEEADFITTDAIIAKFTDQLDKIYVLTDSSREKQVLEKYGDNEKYRVLASPFPTSSFGGYIYLAIKAAEDHDWLLLLDGDATLPQDFHKLICERYLNPGYVFNCDYDKNPIYMFNKLASAVQQKYDQLAGCDSVADFVSLWGDKVQVLQAGFENEPDLDITYFRQHIYEAYEQDKEFVELLKDHISSKVAIDKPILLTHSAFIYHTTSLARLLEDLGYDVYVISSGKFKEHFQGWLSDDKVFYFDGGLFNYENILPLLNKIKSDITFGGAVIPFFPGASTVKPIDAYTDVLKSAKFVAGDILGVINIRREFVTIEYDWENE